MKKDALQFDKLAETPNLEDYQSKPVENYGINLLKNMGFNEEKGIGKRNNRPAEILVLKPRPRGLGLGAQNEEQEKKEEFQIGQFVKIKEGTHEGMFGQVTEFTAEQLTICLFPSDSVVKIKVKNIIKITNSEMKEEKKKISEEMGKQKKLKKLKWIIPHIKVKVIDKNSKYYLKKLLVTQLLSDKQFQCKDEKGNYINDLRQKQIQTAIPKIGGIVIILKGTNQGEKATLLQRHKGKNKVTIQTLDDLEIMKIPEDDVAQYIQI